MMVESVWCFVDTLSFVVGLMFACVVFDEFFGGISTRFVGPRTGPYLPILYRLTYKQHTAVNALCSFAM